MARNLRRLAFDSVGDMSRHLDTWAARSLQGPDQWADALVGAQAWLDYSARNQVLLASYGVDGPVAGAETWRLVPSTTEGRACSVRAGEHGWPVRVPVTTGASEPDPYLGGVRPSRSRTDRFEWRPVFALDQLARRPSPGGLTPAEAPPALTGSGAAERFETVARKVASTTVRGRPRPGGDPHEVLADTAIRLARRGQDPPLDPVLARQAAWLVADRVGLAPGGPPSFDPATLAARDRWRRLQAVLDPTRRLIAAVGHVTGTDLTAGPLPKMDIVDDRAVPASRRRRLPMASFSQLPVGSWVEVGPYTVDEWAARGEHGAGRGAYLRLNRSAYLVAVEAGAEAVWRLEDVAERTGYDLLARGEAPSLDAAKHDAVAALAGRYPALPATGRSPTPGGPGGPGTAPTGDRPAASPWEPMPGEGNTAARQRRLNDSVTLYAFPGPGRWLPAVHSGTKLTPLPYVRSLQNAQEAAELAGRRALRQAAVDTPVGRDSTVAALAASSDYTRTELVDLLRPALLDETANHLAEADAGAEVVADAVRSAGCTPATVVAVLHAEAVDADEIARLLPTIGVPMDDAIRILHDRWDVPRHDAAEALGATASEMRAAGCSAAEVMATRPRDVLRTLPEDPEVWVMAALTMADGGHPTPTIVSHLVAHAPTSDAFATALGALTDDPAEGLATAVQRGAPHDHLAAAAHAYDLTASQAATVLHDAGATPQVTVETVHALCDGDPARTTEAVEAIGIDGAAAQHILTNPRPEVTRLMPDSPDPTDTNSLLAHLPDPEPAVDLHPDALLALLPPADPAELRAPEVQR